MGSSEFAITILDRLIKDNFDIPMVYTQPDKPFGRTKKLKLTPIKEYALKQHLNISNPEDLTSEYQIKKIKSIKPDIILACSYGKIIPSSILDIPTYAAINIHASLLPKLRGSSPIQYAILGGLKETGVTFIEMDEIIDHGPILAQTKIPIYNNDNALSLHDRLAQAASMSVVRVLEDVINNKIDPIAQDHHLATFTKKISRDDGLIDWSKSIEEISRSIRAYSPWPGSFTYISNGTITKRLKIISSSKPETSVILPTDTPTFLEKDNNLYISYPSGSLLLKRVKVEGKRAIPAIDFYKGYKNYTITSKP